MPASWMTIWSLPSLRISGSETPSASTRSRMRETERVHPVGGDFLVLGRNRLQDDLEAALQIEAEAHLLVGGRARDDKRGHACKSQQQQADENQM